jgi:hypothetical protein
MKSIFWEFKRCLLAFCLILSLLSISSMNVQADTPLRRPISNEQPMYLVHIDTWNYADPQKIIDLIPMDIRPYVVMNISLSISHDVATSRFKVAEYGYEIAKSWLRTCAQNQMWATVQHSSGGYAQFSDFDLSVYEEFYRDFPNLIGFNYAEQFWGYDDPSDPLSPKWSDRMAHFANLLKLSNRYGGYLVVSWCGNQWSPSINPIGMMKRSPDFAAACEKYTQNYLLFEKYTQQSYQSDMESICLGAYLSGYSGNYGIRYDDTGWTDATGEHKSFTMATAGAVHLEHMMLTGSTMIDGPELIWTQCFRETNRKPTTDGYSMRDWETFPQFINTTVDYFRKILDGTVRIPSRQEVIDRTKYVIVNDVNNGSADAIYSTPETMFDGLYRMDGDGNLMNNKTFFKKKGRYPTIPTVYKLNDEMAQSFQNKINKSVYSSRWNNVASKVNELNKTFPQEYTGDLYAGRHENGWVVYNPFKTGKIASANIPFKFNTCDSISATFSEYAAAVLKEYPNKVTIYLSNHDVQVNKGLKTNEFKFYGSTQEPTFSFTDRGNHQASKVSTSWVDGVFTLTIQHNGPLDIEVNCAGTATERLTAYTSAKLVEPTHPPVYTGPRQYEAECFDYKSISGITTGGQDGAIRNYSGQGYLRVGYSSTAAVRDTVLALRSGLYQLIAKYAISGGDVNTLDLYVNGAKVATPVFTKTGSESTWNYLVQTVELQAGKNKIELKANKAAAYSLLLDNIVITQESSNGVYHFESDSATSEAANPPAELITMRSGTAGVVSYTNANSQIGKGFKTYSVGTVNGSAVADLDMFPQSGTDYAVVWTEYYTETGGKKGVLLRGTGNHGSCAYAQGMKQGYLFIVLNNADNTITLKPYIAGESGLTSKPTYTTTFKVQPGMPYWLRASAYGSQLKFECSSDSATWEGGATTTFTDELYTEGSIQLVWGLDSNNFSWMMDNISYSQEHISISRLSLSALDYTQGHGPSASQTVSVSGSKLSGSLVVHASENFEVSLAASTGYASSLTIDPTIGEVGKTELFVRLKSGLNIGSYTGEITVNSDFVEGNHIQVSGRITPSTVSRKYDFTNDIATTSAQTPPAAYTTIGVGSSATAGVVAYTDSRGVTSNMFRAYSGGQRNATGAITLDRFSKTATDYSVTWKECVGSSASDYKVGVLLRGNAAKVGDETTGYVQGLMHGYLFIAYTAHGGASKHAEFRIYRSTETLNSLSMLVNSSVSALIPTAEQPVWYRASVSGVSPVSLKLEYSTDSLTWKSGAVSSDIGGAAFTSGATQIVWGLGAGNFNFFLDDIAFQGVESEAGAKENAISVSNTSLFGFGYKFNEGPSASQSFTVSANSLIDDLHIDAPLGYEVSFDQSANYKSGLSLPQNNGSVGITTIYVRLKEGLRGRIYSGEVEVSSIGAITKAVLVDGIVDSDPNGVGQHNTSAVIISKEYFTIAGQRLVSEPVHSGIYIVKNRMSDNRVVVSKELVDLRSDK